MIRIEPQPDSISARAIAASGHAAGLVRYEAACRAIAEAKSVDEVKNIRDTSEAMRAAARIAKNKQAEIDMAEIRFRAERRLGEMMAAQREAGFLKVGGDGSNQYQQWVGEKPKAPTLAEAGIDKNLADRARKFAAIPEAEFDSTITDWRSRVRLWSTRAKIRVVSSGARAA